METCWVQLPMNTAKAIFSLELPSIPASIAKLPELYRPSESTDAVSLDYVPTIAHLLWKFVAAVTLADIWRYRQEIIHSAS